jgi:hypothetical protein
MRLNSIWHFDRRKKRWSLARSNNNHRYRHPLRRRPLRRWCAVGITRTSTRVLDVGATQGWRAPALLPRYLCVVVTDHIADTVPPTAVLDAMKPLTVVSSPNTTTDIELRRAEGLHRLGTLDVLIGTR